MHLTTASSSAPRMTGRFASNAASISSSGLRASSVIVARWIVTARSAKSARSVSEGMPLSTIGRAASKIVSLRSVCSMRVANPLPVASRHNASANHAGTLDRLSNTSAHELPADTTRSRSSFGTARMGAALGSISDADHAREHRFAGALLAVDREHWIRARSRSAATSHATTSMKSSSLRTLRKPRSSSIMPPASGSGNARMEDERNSLTGGLSTTDQPARGYLDGTPMRVAQIEIKVFADASDTD